MTDKTFSFTISVVSYIAKQMTDEDLAYMHRCLYSSDEKIKQDAVLLSFMNIDVAKRRKKKIDHDNASRRKIRDMSVKYFVKKENKELVPVCKGSFMGIFGE